jgi:hypothetical protein
MATIFELYKTLLETYTEQVKGLEAAKKEAEKNHAAWIPHKVLNSRMFTYDEYLNNASYGGWCYAEKNRIMPHLLNFIAAYEKCSFEEKETFEKLKPKNEYQQYLDELYIGKGEFIPFLESQLKDLLHIERTYQIPHKPQRSNATRQLVKYQKELKEYEERIASINRCREEVYERIKYFKALLKN